MNIKDDLNKARKDYGMSSGDTFKIEEGENRVRILAYWEPRASHRLSNTQFVVCYGAENGCPYHGADDKQPSVKFVTWLWNKKSDQVELAFLPWTIVDAIGDFQMSEDYMFDGFPMPYDITIKATNAGTIDVKYTVIPSPKLEEVPTQIIGEFEEKDSPKDVVAKMKDKQQEADNLSGNEPPSEDEEVA